MHVKRWLLLLLAGIVLLSLGLAYLLRHLYADLTFPAGFYYLTLQFLSRPTRALVLGCWCRAGRCWRWCSSAARC